MNLCFSLRNENHPCGGGHAMCKQIYRAQWTLVWSSVGGAQLATHEVPSHCQCMNIGGPVSQARPSSIMAVQLDRFHESNSLRSRRHVRSTAG